MNNYVDPLINRFLRSEVLGLFWGLRGSSGFVLSLFFEKRTLESSDSVSNTLYCGLKRGGSST
mgnify:CR=1 FL=1|jgi:hypothetical protein